MSRSATGWARAIVLVGARLAGAAEPPSTDQVLAMLYPGGQITVDAEGRHVIRGGAHAVPSALPLQPGMTDKVVSRVTWFSGPVVTPDRDDRVVLVEAYNLEAASCCDWEVMLGVITAGDGGPRLLWSQRFADYTRGGQVSFVSAKADGTKQILLMLNEGRGADAGRKAILFAARPAGNWRGLPGLEEHLEGAPPDAAYVPIWIGYFEVNPPDHTGGQPRFREFEPVRFVATIQFSDRITNGWRDLIETRMVSMLLGQELTPPLIVKAEYRFWPGNGYEPKK